MWKRRARLKTLGLHSLGSRSPTVSMGAETRLWTSRVPYFQAPQLIFGVLRSETVASPVSNLGASPTRRPRHKHPRSFSTAENHETSKCQGND